MSEILSLIRSTDDKILKEILKKIKSINKEAYKFMASVSRPYRPLKQRRYRLFVRTNIWIRGKRALWEYYTRTEQNQTCKYCNKDLKSNKVLHHDTYNWTNLFTPNYAYFCCRKCHKEIHGGEK